MGCGAEVEIDEASKYRHRKKRSIAAHIRPVRAFAPPQLGEIGKCDPPYANEFAIFRRTRNIVFLPLRLGAKMARRIPDAATWPSFIARITRN